MGAAFAVATFAYDTAIDVSPSDAQRRSAEFAIPTYAAALRTPLAQGGGARFNELAAHHGYTTVALVVNHDDGRPPDTATSAVRSWTETNTGHGNDGWTGPMGSAVLFVTLTRPAAVGPWRVASVQIPSAN